MTRYEQNQLLHEDSHWRYWKESQKASITVGGQFPEKTIRIFTDKYNAYSGKHNFLCNTGYEKAAKQSITLTFEKPGVYTFDKLKSYVSYGAHYKADRKAEPGGSDRYPHGYKQDHRKYFSFRT